MQKSELIEFVWSFGFGGMEKVELDYMYDLSHNKVILELGSEMGQSAYVMASVADSIICVDAWDDDYEHLNNDTKQKGVYLNAKKEFENNVVNKNDVFGQFKKNCKEFIESGKLKYIKAKTLDVVDDFKNEHFDIILIDADHSFEGVYGDINAYIPKLKKDGYLVFHDYGCGMWTGVKDACDRAVSEEKIEFVSQSNRVAVFALKN